MAAKKSVGTAGRMRAKNSAMAAAMKAAGEERNTGKCPICNRTIAVNSLYNHIVSCKRD
jgi:ribosomal protein L37AE/L43A